MKAPLGAPDGQRGAVTLFLSLLMLLLITVLVTTAFTISTTNLRSVGNLQARYQALAAAQAIIETELGGPFYTTPKALLNQMVDIDGDGNDDFKVNLAKPLCVRAARAATATVSSVTLPGMSASSYWQTIWEFTATVSDTRTGASAVVVQAVRALLSDSQKMSSCN